MEKFGLIDKPIVNKDGMVIGGHQRIAVLKKMGIKEVECYVPQEQLSYKEVSELNIRLNRNIGEFDFDVLANDWIEEDLLAWGFNPEELGIESEETKDEEQKIKKKKMCPNCGHEF